MYKFLLAAAFGGLFADLAQGQAVYATQVEASGQWRRIGQAQGAPANQNCNTSGGPTTYAYNDGGTDWIEAVDMQDFQVPPGMAIASVQVAVLARYDSGMAGNARIQARWHGKTASRDRTFSSSGTQCGWRPIELTSEEADFWSQDELNALQIRIRRLNTPAANWLRVKAFRVVVSLAPDCDGNGIVDSLDLAMGAPDCDQNGVLDACDIASGAVSDCNGDGVPDRCNAALVTPQPDQEVVDFEEDTLFVVTNNDVGFDPSWMRVQVVTQPSYGTISAGSAPGQFQFRPSSVIAACGWTSFQYRIINRAGCDAFNSAPATVALDVRQSGTDCNGNCLEDSYEILIGIGRDCDGDGVLTECELGFEDCNGNGYADCTEIFVDPSKDLNDNGVLDACENESVFTYCQPMVNSQGCQTRIDHFGVASAQASTFMVFTENAIQPTFGLLLWSRHPSSLPFQGGTLCVGGSIQRGLIGASTPSAFPPPCNGRLVYRWTSARLQGAGLAPGDLVYNQIWSRDMSSPFGSNVTDAVRFGVLP